jgi:transcriptional regulator with XRE-family HTH domain
MPAASPAPGEAARGDLVALGAALRARRKALRLSAVTTAEAAGLSRVTLHRIERGEPSVTVGAVAAVAAALGLQVGVTSSSTTEPASLLPARIPIAAYPELRRLAWQLAADTVLSPHETWSSAEKIAAHVMLTRGERSELAEIAANLL